MRSISKQLCYSVALLGVGCLGTVAAAPPMPASGAGATTSLDAQATVSVIPGFGASVDRSTLGRLTGGTRVNEDITINGSVSNTSASDVSTGPNWIGGGSFGSAVGLPTVIQNSGNGVLIQNATIVNVQMQP